MRSISNRPAIILPTFWALLYHPPIFHHQDSQAKRSRRERRRRLRRRGEQMSAAKALVSDLLNRIGWR